jgi:hypothetical protein
MQITLDTENPGDLKILRALLAAADADEGTSPAPVPAAQPEPKSAAKKAAAPKAEAAPDKPAKTAAPAPSEDLQAQAVARATELVSSGKAHIVKSALDEHGAERVGKQADDQYESFLAALDRLSAEEE